ncbi:hypothetical protein AWE51_18890 [Aquimarina aggregata]|uniref:Deacetylase PdaC domain-containing protein n=1 Tax=Aquimarina aggregata TaxID=1642818 RepID=A0A162WHW4_9FLAO|nr:DUF3298 and DUF4163 domain-containing protein [Aquimarina aggregata]KZS38113.1 hypothetical protein AWE51_18890 [Aquimarina aggregata]
MINTKPNTLLKFVFSLGIFLLIYSCTTNETFTFEKQNFTVDNLPNCKDSDCASLEINLLQVIDDRPICKDINKEIEKAACSILNTEEKASEENMNDAIHQFNRSYQEISNEFPDETVPYEASIDCKLSFTCQGLISVSIDSYIFTGGAHGYSSLSFINIDSKTGKRIPNRKLLKDPSEFENYIEKVFRQNFEIPETASINSTGFFFENETFKLPENIGFTATDIILHYNQYEISSYAEGPVVLKLDKKEISSFFAINIE